MKLMFLPIIALMNRLNYPLKMLLILFLFGLPIITVMTLLYQQVEKSITFSKSEQQGVEYINPLYSMLEHLVEHDSIVSDILKGNDSLKKDLVEIQKKLDSDIQAIDAVDQKLGATLEATSSWGLLRNRVLKLRTEATSLSLDKNTKAHDAVINDILSFIILTADNSNLTLDPDIDSYYAMDTITTKLPALTKIITQLDDVILKIVANKNMASDDKTALIVNEGLINSLMDSIAINMRKIAEKNPQAAQNINTKYAVLVAEYNKFSGITKGKLINSTEITLTPQEYIAINKSMRNSVFRLNDALSPALNEMLRIRISSYRNDVLVAEGSIVTGLILVIYVFFGFYFSVSNATTALKQAAERIASGDFGTRIKIETRDELATVALGFDKMTQQVGDLLARAQDENRSNQEAILRLLDEVSDLADGNLTRKPLVTADVTGAIADSLGYAIETLRTLVGAINTTAEQVATGASSTQEKALQLTMASDRQAQGINTAGTAVSEMTKSIGRVSRNAIESSSVAKQSVEIAKRGTQTVQGTIQGMETIREQIQETSKRIKRLGESSQEIGEIVGLIHSVAYQTNILALNAAIQAAMAGEAGRGFSVVADEVQRLSKRVSNSARQIENLVKTIQTDASEAVISMEKSTSGVVSGTRLAQDAGKALAEIETVSINLDRLIEGISNAAREQTDTAGTVSHLMKMIQDITTQTSQGTKQAAASIGELTGMAGELKKSVAGFKLPG